MLPKELLREVKRIEIKTRHLVESLYAGGYRSVFKGRGIEFAGIREYYRGDEFRSIDWKVSARTGRFHVREHIEERELQVIVALDLSASMEFGSGNREKRESAVEFAAAMSMAAEKNNDRVGACLFTDSVEKFIVPAKGRTHILRLIRDLLYFVPKAKKTDLKSVLDFLNSTVTRRSIIFLVTDAINFSAIDREIRITAARHDLVLVLMRDPREHEIPDIGLIEIEDPETGEETLFDTSDRAAVQELLARRSEAEQGLLKRCRNLGIDSIEILAGESVVKAICRLFAEREKRISLIK
ncbi:MAG: hypothetical protein PWR01_4250 [Clostridiales bacterium]|jgi:uncharacterized protein (DUF58 family)|nr:hypothetical protein [Clostridiales bacterium]MDN5283177.1 hypothetical protein [Candidatus Ozemobacter sp.]